MNLRSGYKRVGQDDTVSKKLVEQRYPTELSKMMETFCIYTNKVTCKVSCNF